jgi:DNA-binding response OmpR family regulator
MTKTIINQTKPKIVLVEDDTFLAGIYASKFEAAGFNVSLATDGEAGLETIEKEMPDVVLLDIILPKMDGFEVLEKVKSNPKTKDIPVILLTNLGQREDVEKGLKLGAADYLIKAHFMPQETIERVKKVMGIIEK